LSLTCSKTQWGPSVLNDFTEIAPDIKEEKKEEKRKKGGRFECICA
jgi:hypothetical protein